MERIVEERFERMESAVGEAKESLNLLAKNHLGAHARITRTEQNLDLPIRVITVKHWTRPDSKV